MGIESKTTLSAHPPSVGAARRYVRDVLMSRRVAQPVVDTVELLTSEVVTNAILHAASAPELVVRLGEARGRGGACGTPRGAAPAPPATRTTCRRLTRCGPPRLGW